MKTVIIQMKTVARAIKTVVVATSPQNFFWIFGARSVYFEIIDSPGVKVYHIVSVSDFR